MIYGGPLMLISLAMIFGVVPWTVRMREHMARSIAATEQILASRMVREY